MKALVFHHPKKVVVEEVNDPKIIKDTDLILKVTSTAICGSDLHMLIRFFAINKITVLKLF